MLKRRFLWPLYFPAILILFFCRTSAGGYDLNDKFSIAAVAAGAYQYQTGDDVDDKGRGAVPFQVALSFRPTASDEFFTKFGFAAGNGLNDVTDFTLAPWAADLEDDVKGINGRNRDYLLTVWYRHTFQWSENHSLGLTGGIIDATDYVDENAYANDEYTQFMNEALVNAPNGFAPSYDIGGTVEWKVADWSIKGVGMNVGENDDGNNYNFFAAQIGYTINTPLGQGHYRLVGQGTSKDFLDQEGNEQNRWAALLSFDQQLGDIFGAWIRFEWQDDDAVVNYDYLLSGGLNITGQWYGREKDNIGIGYAYLNGASDSDFDHIRVAEVYWRLVLNEYFAVTADFQYMAETYDTDEDEIHGLILGIRATAAF